MEYILVKKDDTDQNAFNGMGLTEDQFGEIGQAEKILKVLINQYMTNIRLGAYSLSITPDEYKEVQSAEKALNYFLAFVQSLPEAKHEFDKQKILDEAKENVKKQREKKVK